MRWYDYGMSWGIDMSCDIMCKCEKCNKELERMEEKEDGVCWECDNSTPEHWPYGSLAWSKYGDQILRDNLPHPDLVESPTHYKVFPDTEAIDIIKKVLTPTEYVGYLKGNLMKYRLRAGEKDSMEQDIRKANKYRDWLGDEF